MNIRKTALDLLKFIRNHPDYSKMHNDPPRILKAMDEFSARDFLINIGPEKGAIVTRLIAREKPTYMVEIGGYVGYSSILFANEMRKSNPNARFWTLEYDRKYSSIISEMIDLAGLQDVVTVVTGSADKSLRQLKVQGALDQIDLLFIDHDEDLYEQDLKIAMDELGSLRSGATIVADNVLYPGAPDYRNYCRNHKGMKSRGVKGRLIPGYIMDELEISKVL